MFYYYIIIIVFHLSVVAYCIIIIAFHLSVVDYCIIIIAFHLSIVDYCIIIIAFHFSVVLLLHCYYCIPSQCCCIVTGPLWQAENFSWMTDAGKDGETVAIVQEKVIEELNQKLASMKLSWRSPQDSAEMDMQLQSASTALSSYEVQQLLCVTLPCYVFVALFLTDVLCVCDDVKRLCSDCP